MFKVTWNESVCQHAGVCVKTLPTVFKIENSSFVIDSDAADESKIREVCNACPSGALAVSEA